MCVKYNNTMQYDGDHWNYSATHPPGKYKHYLSYLSIWSLIFGPFCSLHRIYTQSTHLPFPFKSYFYSSLFQKSFSFQMIKDNNLLRLNIFSNAIKKIDQLFPFSIKTQVLEVEQHSATRNISCLRE